MSPGGGWLRSPWEVPHLAPELAISMGSLSTCFMCCSLLMAVPPPPRPAVGVWNRSTLVGPAAVGFRSLPLDDYSLPWRLGGRSACSRFIFILYFFLFLLFVFCFVLRLVPFSPSWFNYFCVVLAFFVIADFVIAVFVQTVFILDFVVLAVLV